MLFSQLGWAVRAWYRARVVALDLGADDAALLAALRRGDERAFTAVVDGWSPAMLRVARAYVGSPSIAEEVVQEAWLGVLKGLDGFEGRSRLRTWVLRIVANIAQRRGEREARVLPLAHEALGAEATVDPARFRAPGEPYAGGWREFPATWPQLPEGELLTREAEAVVRAAIGRLPDAQRTVIVLRDVEGYAAEEVCTILGLSDGNQRVLLHRARAAVRRRVEAYFSDQSVARAEAR